MAFRPARTLHYFGVSVYNDVMDKTNAIKKKTQITMTVDEYEVFSAYAKRRDMKLSEFARASMKSEIRRRIRDKYWLKQTPPNIAEFATRAACMPIDADTVVYFVKDGEHIKIGMTKDIGKRIATMRTDNPREFELLAVFPGSREMEKALHATFAFCRIRNEWFFDNPNIYAFIEAMRATQKSVL